MKYEFISAKAISDQDCFAAHVPINPTGKQFLDDISWLLLLYNFFGVLNFAQPKEVSFLFIPNGAFCNFIRPNIFGQLELDPGSCQILQNQTLNKFIFQKSCTFFRFSSIFFCMNPHGS